MKIKHHSIFNELSTDTIDWSVIRSNKKEKGYYLPDNLDVYLKERKNENKYEGTVIEISNIIKSKSIKRVVSLGSGIAALEYHLKNGLEIQVEVSDLDHSIKILDSFKIFDKVFALDLKSDFKIEAKDSLVILSRIDTELTDKELKNLFERLNFSSANLIYFIPAQPLNFFTIVREIKIILYSILKRKKRVFCGYSRSKKSFINSWTRNYRYMSLNSNNFLLHR
jgi:hypothetical protein